MGLMWSTSVAGVSSPCSLQCRHNGFRRRNQRRKRFQSVSYPRFDGDSLGRGGMADGSGLAGLGGLNFSGRVGMSTLSLAFPSR